MMLIINRFQLLPALQAAIKAVARRNDIQILSHVKIEVLDNSLILTATNCDLQITVKAGLVENSLSDLPKALALPGGLFHDAIKKLPDDAQISIGNAGNGVEIVSNRSKFKVQTLPADNLPIMDFDGLVATFEITPQGLEDIITKISFAISSEETRYYLNGIHLHSSSDGFCAVATDGHRLAKTKITLMGKSEQLEKIPPIIVPRHFWQIVKGLFKATSAITVSVSGNKIIMSQDEITIISKLIDGTFPDYQRVVPQDNDKTFCLNRAALMAALDRISTIASNRNRAVRCVFTNKRLSLFINDVDNGTAEDDIEVLSSEYDALGEPLEIGFNAHYAMDILTACGTEKVVFALKDSAAPLKILPINESADLNTEEDTLFILMPMRL